MVEQECLPDPTTTGDEREYRPGAIEQLAQGGSFLRAIYEDRGTGLTIYRQATNYTC